MPAPWKKLGPIAVAAGLFVISAVSAGRGGLAAEREPSNELEQATVNMLDTGAMSAAMTSFVQNELIARAANTRQAAGGRRRADISGLQFQSPEQGSY
jgi:hypothetical protein